MSHPASSRGTTDRMTPNRSTAARRAVHGGSVRVVPVPSAGVIRVYHQSADGRLHGLAEIHPPPGVPLDAGKVNVLVAGADKRGIPVVRVQVPPSWRGATNRRRDVRVTRASADDPHRLRLTREIRRELRTLYRAYQADTRFQIDAFGAVLPATADIERMSDDELVAKAEDPHFKRWLQQRRWRARRESIRRENLRYQSMLGGPASGYTPAQARRIVRGSRQPPSKLGLPLYDEATGVHFGYVRTLTREKGQSGAVGTVTREIYDLEGKRLNPNAKGHVALTPAADIFQDLARQAPVLGYAINVAEIFKGESLNLRDWGRNLSDYEVADRAISELPLLETVRTAAEITSGVSLSGGADLERYWKGEARILSHRERVGKSILAGTALAAGAVGSLQVRHGPELHPIIGRRTIGSDDITVDPVPLKTPAPKGPVSARGTAGSRHTTRRDVTPATQDMAVQKQPSSRQPEPMVSALPAQRREQLAARPSGGDTSPPALPEAAPAQVKPAASQRMVAARGTEGSRQISRYSGPARRAVAVMEGESMQQFQSLSSAALKHSPKPLSARRSGRLSGSNLLPEFEPNPVIILMDRHNLPPRSRSKQKGGFKSLGERARHKAFQTGKKLGLTEQKVKMSLSNSLAFVNRFVKKFHDIPGFEKVLADYLRGIRKTKHGYRMRQGARYVMEFVEANFTHSKRLLKQGKMSFELRRGKLRVMDLKVFDTRYEFKSVMAFRSYNKHLRQQLRRDLGDLLAQMPDSPDGLHWVFDEDRLRKGMQVDGLPHHRMPRDALRLQVIKDMRNALRKSFANHERRADLERWLDQIVIVW